MDFVFSLLLLTASLFAGEFDHKGCVLGKINTHLSDPQMCNVEKFRALPPKIRRAQHECDVELIRLFKPSENSGPLDFSRHRKTAAADHDREINEAIAAKLQVCKFKGTITVSEQGYKTVVGELTPPPVVDDRRVEDGAPKVE